MTARWRARAPLAAAAALAAAASAPTARDLAVRWSDPLSYDSHGPLVPLVSAWLLWRHRDELAATPRAPSLAGPAVTAASLWLIAASTLESVLGGQALGVVGLAVGIALSFFGAAFVRRAWFAFAFLLFAVPAPMSLNLALSARMQALAAALSAASLRTAGVPAVRDGTAILLESGSVTVGDACSGLRGLSALVAMAALVASFRQRRLGSAAVLLVAAPIAIVSNTARILLLCAIALAGGGVREGLLHEATGVVTYVVALLLLLAVHSFFRGDEDPAATPDSGKPTAPPVHPAPAPRPVVAALTIALLAGGVALVAHSRWRHASERRPTDVARRVPASAGPWTSVELPLANEALVALGTDDVVVRRYSRAELDATVDVYVNHAAGGADRIWHPPEWCYLVGGFEVVSDESTTIVTPTRRIPARRFVFRRDIEGVLVCYWYRINGRDVARYLDFESTSLLRRLAGLGESEATLVRLATSLHGGREAAESRLVRFAAEALDEVLAPVQ